MLYCVGVYHWGLGEGYADGGVVVYRSGRCCGWGNELGRDIWCGGWEHGEYTARMGTVKFTSGYTVVELSNGQFSELKMVLDRMIEGANTLSTCLRECIKYLIYNNFTQRKD